MTVSKWHTGPTWRLAKEDPDVSSSPDHAPESISKYLFRENRTKLSTIIMWLINFKTLIRKNQIKQEWN